jgi:hypothetical protein
MVQQLEDSNTDLHNKLRNKAEEFESFSLAMDDSNDPSNTGQLLIIIQGVTEYLRWSKN